MREPTGGARPVTLGDLFDAKGKIRKAVEEGRDQLSRWKRFRWRLAGIDGKVDTGLARMFGSSIDGLIEGVFQSEAQDGVRATFGEISKLLKKATRTRKELHRYQRATPADPAAFKLGIKQTITLNLEHTFQSDVTGVDALEIKLNIRIVLVFEDASVGVARRAIHYLSLGNCHVGQSSLKCAVGFGGGDPVDIHPEGGFSPGNPKQALGRIDFNPPIPIPFMDRRTGMDRRTEPRRIGGERRVQDVPVETEQRVFSRRMSDRRGEEDRRRVDRRGTDRREGVERRIDKDRRASMA